MNDIVNELEQKNSENITNENEIKSRLSVELQKGKAGEHLVCADLILQGYNAFLSDAGQNYDVLVDHEGKLFKIQVRSSEKPWKLRNLYRFGMREGKKHNQKAIYCSDCYAFVALDIRKIAYMPSYLLSNKNGKIISLVELKNKAHFGRTFDMFSQFEIDKIVNKKIKDADQLYRLRKSENFNYHPRGEKHFNAKLDTKEVIQLKEMYSTGNFTMCELAKKFKTTYANVWSILNNKTRVNG